MPKTVARKRSKESENQSVYSLRPCQSKISFLQRIEQRVKADKRKFSEENLQNHNGKCIKDLPPEIMIKILSHLDVRNLSVSVAPVCRQWFIYANTPVLWRSLRFQDNKVQTHNALALLRQAPQLKRLEIIDQHDRINLLMEVCQSNRQLEHIMIKCSFNPNSTRLSRFALNFSTDPFYFEWSSMESIFDDFAIPHLPTGKTDHSYIPSSILLRLLRACRYLKSIKLIGIEIRSRLFLKELSQLPKLRSVDVTVGDHGGIMAWELIYFLRNHVGEGTRVAPLYLHAIYNWCDRGSNILPHWTLHGSNMAHIIGFLASSIVVLNLDATVMNDDMGEELLKCASLQALHLSNAVSISSALVVKLLTRLQYLLSLRINQAYSLHPTVLLAAFHRGLRCNEQNKIKSPLKYLSMADCPGIDDASILALVSYCPHVEHLSFAQCQKITDEGLCCIIWFCHNLRSLNLWSCSGLHGRSFKKIPMFAPHLKLLMVGDKGTSGFKDKKREEKVIILQKLMPSLKIHFSLFPPRGWTMFCGLSDS